MKIQLIGKPKVIMSNPTSKHHFFAWPSVVRLQNGKLAVGASGYRLSHICPFGKTVIAFSDDEGETYTMPMPIIDTVLDDRDAGLCTFGESGLIVTSFNNSAEYQRNYAKSKKCPNYVNYRLQYIDTITKEEEEQSLGVTYRISHDCGVTFGQIYRSPITSPHGPIELSNGTVLWVGTNWSSHSSVEAHVINTKNGQMKKIGEIEPIDKDGERLFSCEPDIVELPNGTILCHLRVQEYSSERRIFTLYQTESIDGGRTWTKPVQIIGDLDGAPAHLYLTSKGLLISAYSRREVPYGIRVMFSKDYGKTWDANHVLFENPLKRDGGYPATVERKDGSLLTVFYTYPDDENTAVICQQIWNVSEE